MKNKNKNKKNTTQYGEFIPSYYAWIGTDKQKDIANRLEKITKQKNKT